MLKLFRARRSSVLIWALIALLIVGLAGFGIGVSGLGGGWIARVGAREVAPDAYARALQQEIRAISSQLGRTLPMSEARQFGIDRVVLTRLVNDAALDAEAERLGLSSGDAAVRDQVAATAAFQGTAGGFDRETYRFALERAGLTAAEFEALLRDELTREALAASVQAPVAMPDTAALTILGFLGEQRRFDWLRLGADQLDAPVAAPTEADLAAYLEENAARYTRPETQMITYAAVSPAALASEIAVPEEALRAAYEADPARFNTPERRILDRIGFGSMEEAAAAKSRIAAGETSFDAVAAERGLSPEETDQGVLTAADLPPEARDAVFAAEPGLVGPLATPLGPALYRVNAVLNAVTVPFEEARETLAAERAAAAAQTRIREAGPVVEDLVAGGASLEEIAAETDLTLAQIALNAETAGGIADDPAFRSLAAEARPGEETDPATLADGGLVVLRVDEVQPPALMPLQEIRERVAADWSTAESAARLAAQAEALAAEIDGGTALAAVAQRLDLPIRPAGPLTRGETLPEAPAELVAEVFAAPPGGTAVLRDGDGAILAQVTGVVPFDPEAPENAELMAQFQAELRAQAADDALVLFTAAVRDAAGVSIDQSLIESTLARFP